jgi:hypothetical protein
VQTNRFFRGLLYVLVLLAGFFAFAYIFPSIVELPYIYLVGDAIEGLAYFFINFGFSLLIFLSFKDQTHGFSQGFSKKEIKRIMDVIYAGSNPDKDILSALDSKLKSRQGWLEVFVNSKFFDFCFFILLIYLNNQYLDFGRKEAVVGAVGFVAGWLYAREIYFCGFLSDFTSKVLSNGDPLLSLKSSLREYDYGIERYFDKE